VSNRKELLEEAKDKRKSESLRRELRRDGVGAAGRSPAFSALVDDARRRRYVVGAWSALDLDAGVRWLDGRVVHNGDALEMLPASDWTGGPITCRFVELASGKVELHVDGLKLAFTPQMRFRRPT